MNPVNLSNTDWDTWKKTLGQAVEFAEGLGISKQKISSLAQQAGDLLAESVHPANPEQKVIKELWDVAEPEERKLLAALMTRLVS
ncbi:MAG TPA: DUF3243 domain-containing protein [Pelotomaculum sp.]|nr:DUF3243 domain-containing protein [Pelotomaculum sp.]